MKSKTEIAKPSDTPRYSGVLAHPSSFPSPYGIGDFGPGAYEFIDYLTDAGQTLWQILPLGPTGFGDSPYQSFSSFAGQTLFISPDFLVKDGLLQEADVASPPVFSATSVDYGAAIVYKNTLYKLAYKNFSTHKFPELKKEFREFCKESRFWLKDYALFMASKDAHQGRCWLEWDDEMTSPTASVKNEWIKNHKDQVTYYQFLQFLFFRQWKALKAYANQRGIRIIGDIPIFVSLDSVDVWANKSLFQLDSKGYPTQVAGVPPDYFSETGQLWGNPLYDWKKHKRTGYKWWIARIRHQLQLVDILRIDHFRGFSAYWAVPYGESTAIHGQWIKGPGADLFDAIETALGKDLPILAEDLGVITEDVEELRDAFHFPGMRVLQFAFDDPKDNIMMPHNHIENCVCYTGTHDNDTSKGWYLNASKDSQKKAREYMNTGAADISWAFIRTALSSVAKYTIVPLQDILGLGSEGRMNLPGHPGGNWCWRYTSNQLDKDWQAYFKALTIRYHREGVTDL